MFRITAYADASCRTWTRSTGPESTKTMQRGGSRADEGAEIDFEVV